MRFHIKFQRRVGAGSDEIPALPSKQARPSGAPHAKHDNVLQLRPANINGFPVQRVAIGLAGPEGSQVPVAVFVHDELSSRWFLADVVTVRNGCIAYADVPTIAHMNAQSSDGALEMFVVPFMPEDTKDAPAGEYLFVAGGDVSSG